jgi:hypothetical protein
MTAALVWIAIVALVWRALHVSHHRDPWELPEAPRPVEPGPRWFK